ncbi:hypothetical protein AAFF_G00085270 [Aldrovandia affinis]|uniref:Uncharacterized protein n=1 Tax=Aldrovandia affinis TaxID=143900 RepID=A0AAD7WCQ5_9TELE|nr:hypothetical protein AAFF_G00085270 [Aldrovandia affinis]
MIRDPTRNLAQFLELLLSGRRSNENRTRAVLMSVPSADELGRFGAASAPIPLYSARTPAPLMNRDAKRWSASSADGPEEPSRPARGYPPFAFSIQSPAI